MNGLTLSDAEKEFIYILREQNPRDDYLRVTIELVDKIWITSITAATLKGRKHTIRGTGRTFSEAWELTGVAAQA